MILIKSYRHYKQNAWSFKKQKCKNFGVDHSSVIHADNCKYSFLWLSKVPADDFNSTVSTTQKKVSINITKTNVKFGLSLHFLGDKSYFFNGKGIYKFRSDSQVFNDEKNYKTIFRLLKQLFISYCGLWFHDIL